MAKLVEDLIRDTGITEDNAAIAKRFSGYLGNSGLSTRTRLYLNEQLNEYIEVANAQLLATVDLGGENSPLVLILTKPDAVIYHTALVTDQVQADFLAGEIAQRNLQDNRPLWGPESDPPEFILNPSLPCASIGSCMVRTSLVSCGSH